MTTHDPEFLAYLAQMAFGHFGRHGFAIIQHNLEEPPKEIHPPPLDPEIEECVNSIIDDAVSQLEEEIIAAIEPPERFPVRMADFIREKTCPIDDPTEPTRKNNQPRTITQSIG